MKKSIFIIISTLAFFGLTGCDKKYSVSEMVKDPKLRSKVINKCNEGKYEPMSANCINADKAASIASRNLYSAVKSSVIAQ